MTLDDLDVIFHTFLIILDVLLCWWFWGHFFPNSVSTLRRSCWNLRSCGNPGAVLFKSLYTGPGHKILWLSWSGPLQEVLIWRSCRCHVLEVLVWRLFWDARGRSLWDLSRSSPAGPSMTILWDSLRGPGMKIGVKVFYGSSRGTSCRDPGGIP